MPLAVVERIAVELYSRLTAMVNSPTYETCITQVVRPTRLGDFTPINGTIVLTQGAPQRVPELDYPGNPPAICYRQMFNLRYLLLTDENDDTPIDTTMNQAHADIVLGVTESSSDWVKFDNNAFDAEFQPLEYVGSDGGPDGFNLPLLVSYRVSEYDPTTAR
jgi:hypothetical protein